MEELNYIPEKDLNKAPDYVPNEVLGIIIDQARGSVCKIKCKYRENGIGFFCIIPFPNKNHSLPILMTTNHVILKKDIIKGNKIFYSMNNNKKVFEITIDDYRKVYSNEIFSVTFIEIKENDDLDFDSFLEIDDKVFQDNPNDIFKNNSIYLIGNPKGRKSLYSMGLIKDINEDNFEIKHLSKTDPESSGCPIINLNNNKVIGIHKGPAKNGQNWNLGTFLKGPLEQFKKENLNIQSNNDISSINNNIEEVYEEDNYDNYLDEMTIIYETSLKDNKISDEFINRIKNKWGETISEKKFLEKLL